MIRAVGLLDQTVSTTTTTLPPSASTLLPGVGATSTTTLGPAGSTTSSLATTSTSVAKSTTTLAQTTTTLAHRAAAAAQAATTSTTTGNGSAASNDRGVIHQFLINRGASPSTAHTWQIYLAAPLKVIFILIVAILLTRLVSRMSHRLVNGMRLVSPLVQATPRGAARVQTLAGAFTSIFRALIWVIAILEILSELSINLAPFIAGATVIGAALGFGAQSLVKDFLSGILILAEDQYGVGDHIAVGTGANITSGTVESVNLRVTRLRGADGGILYVPNGDIRTVSNDTETDSQALVDVVVPYGTDLIAAGIGAQDAAREMAHDPDWESEFVTEPYFAGVQDANNGNGVVIRIIALTRPGQHLRLAREMRYRIVERLRRQHIAWGAPDSAPAELPTQAQVRKARAEKRRAEQKVAELMVGPAGRVSKRSAEKRASRKAAAKAIEQGGDRGSGETPEGGRRPDPDGAEARKDQPGDAGGSDAPSD